MVSIPVTRGTGVQFPAGETTWYFAIESILFFYAVNLRPSVEIRKRLKLNLSKSSVE